MGKKNKRGKTKKLEDRAPNSSPVCYIDQPDLRSEYRENSNNDDEEVKKPK
jgi:hypothetical protein